MKLSFKEFTGNTYKVFKEANDFIKKKEIRKEDIMKLDFQRDVHTSDFKVEAFLSLIWAEEDDYEGDPWEAPDYD